MPATPVRHFDVWFVAANTVYKKVPFQVVAEWVQGGRLAGADRLRPAGTDGAWRPLGEFHLLTDYLPRPRPLAVPEEGGDPPLLSEAEDDVDLGYAPRKRGRDEDDDPDMIPFIDISLVLLIFFIMMRASGALSPVDVPDMRYAGELGKDPDAITVAIEKKSADEVTYSVRVGDQPPRAGRAGLATPEAALAALKEELAAAPRPPEVRVACAKDLPSERVFELVRELKPLRERNLINSFTAEVNERAKK